MSGLARGIDSTAHKAVLEAGGRTIAVLDSGLDRIYPQRSIPLADKIVQSGAMLTVDWALEQNRDVSAVPGSAL